MRVTNNLRVSGFLLCSFWAIPSVAQQPNAQGIIEQGCSNQEYTVWSQAMSEFQKYLLEVLTGARQVDMTAVATWAKNWGDQLSPECKAAIRQAYPDSSGEVCTPAQLQKMIAHNSTVKWPQPVMTRCPIIR